MGLIKRDAPASKEQEGEGSTQSRQATMPTAAPKRRPAALGVALSLAAVGGLAFWNFQQDSEASPYLTVNKGIARGEVIEQSMLATVDVTGEPQHLVPAESAEQVIGKVATADLSAGTTLTQSSATDGLGVEEGEAVVGLSLAAGRLPSRDLVAGDEVRVIYTPTTEQVANDLDGGTAGTQVEPIEAVVEGTGHDDASGNTVVDLSVAGEDAPTVAEWGAKTSASIALGPAAGGLVQDGDEKQDSAKDEDSAEDSSSKPSKDSKGSESKRSEKSSEASSSSASSSKADSSSSSSATPSESASSSDSESASPSASASSSEED